MTIYTGGTAEFGGQELPSRFWEKVRLSDEGCWIWIAGRFNTGYGAFNYDGIARTAHSVAYEALVGPVDDGLELDHLCRRRECCNPEHLEPVTHAENVQRGLRGPKDSCPKGHPYEVKGGYKRCTVCSRAQRGWQGGPPMAERTHCPQGHEYAGDNLIVEKSTGRRRCRICKSDTARRYREKVR